MTITANNDSKTYGTLKTFSATAYTETGLATANGDTITGVTETSTGALASASVGTYNIVPGSATVSDPGNYNPIVYVNGQLTVNPAPLTITANNDSKTYGTPQTFSATAYTYTGLVTANGDTITGVTETSTGASVSATVGTYNIILGAATGTGLGNYTIMDVNGQLTVNPATLTITANNDSKTYGTLKTFIATAYTYTGLVTANGDTITGVTETSTGASVSATVGTDPIVPSGAAGSGLSNYTIGYVNGALTVNQATLTITASNPSKVYGAADPTLTYTISGYVNNETAATGGVTGTPSLSTTATAASPAGPYPITLALGTLQATNYTFALQTVPTPTLTVTPAPLTITANNQSRTYGDVNPVFKYSITGLVNGDFLDQSKLFGSPAFTTTAVDRTSASGVYPITITQGTLAYADQNYRFDSTLFLGGMLTILPAPLTIALNMPSYLTRSYGAANPSLNLPLDDFSYTGFMNGDNQDDALTGTPSVSTVATMTSPVGSYPITINAGLLSSQNYTFTFESETLTVVPAVLTVTSVTATRSYGTTTANTQFYTIIGFANGQVLATSDVTGTPGIATTTTATSFVGTYPGTPALGTLKSTNYTFAFAPGTGTLQITPAQLTVSANDISRFYGLANPNLTYTITGFANGETAATGGVTGSPLLSTTAVASSPVGTYPITVQKGTLAATNYDFVILENFGVLTVNTAWLIVRAHDVEQSFGTPNPQSLGWDLVREDAPQTIVSAADPDPELTGTPTLSTQANSDSNSGVGTYPITPTQGTLSVGNPNYALDTSSFQSGTFTITPAPLTITAKNVIMIYADGTTLSGDSGYTVSDPVEGSLSVTLSTNATFSSSHNYNAGTWNITPSAAIGSELSNYSITYIAGQLTVNQLGLTVSGLTASKGYNDNITTGITIGGMASLNTPVSGDNVSLNAASASASFDNANVGTTHTVNFSGYALSGSDSANYSLTQPSIITGVITAAPLTIRANNQTQDLWLRRQQRRARHLRLQSIIRHALRHRPDQGRDAHHRRHHERRRGLHRHQRPRHRQQPGQYQPR